MELTIDDALAVLERTPQVLRAWLDGLPDAWLTASEGEGTFSPLDVLGHLIDGEDHDWIPRVRIVLKHGAARAFEPFDRFAFRERHARLDVQARLDLLARRRAESLAALRALELTPEDLARPGLHPELGAVTLGELLATWVVHDLGHLAQVARVMSKAYGAEVGPWAAYLPVLGR